MTTIRPGTLGLLKARQREARGGGAGGGNRLIAADGVQFPDGVRQEQEEPGPGARDVSKRFKERLRGESISRQAAQGQRVEAEEIGRDLPGVGDALDPTSSPGALEARFDAGVFFHYPIMEAISRETVTQDVITSTVSMPAADTSAESTFSVQEDHYLQALHFTSPNNNTAELLVRLQPFGDPDTIPLFWDNSATWGAVNSTAAVGTVLDPATNQLVVPVPFFIRRETDYIFNARTGADGGSDATIHLMITRAPDGARIPR